MKELPSSGSVQKKIRNRLRAKGLRDKDKKIPPPEAAYLVLDLKNSMTLLYFTLEDLRGRVDDRGACEEAIEKVKDLTCKINCLMEKFLETFSERLPSIVFAEYRMGVDVNDHGFFPLPD